MKNPDFIKGLKALTSIEQAKFQDFVKSPYFNQRGNSIKLLEYIFQFRPDFISPLLTKEKIFDQLFPQESYQDQKIRDEFSQLNRLLKRFLADQMYRKQPFLEYTFLIEALRDKDLDTFHRESKKLEQKLEKHPYRNEEYFKVKLKIAEEKNNFFWASQRRVRDITIQEKVDYLDLHYFSVKLRESCEMLNREEMLNMDFQFHLIEEIMTFLENKGKSFLDEPAIMVYWLIFRMLTNPEQKEKYLNLVIWLEKNDHLFPPEEAISLYRHAQNYCTRKINAGKDDFLKEAFRLYRRLLDNKLAFASGFLPHTTFKNIVTVGLRLSDFEWVEKFIYGYKGRVPEKDRENVFHFSLASLMHARNHPNQTIKHLQNVQFSDVHYQISARQLLLKAFFQTEDWQTLDYQIDAMNIFLKRNRDISPSSRNNHLNFLKLLKPIARFYEKILITSLPEQMRQYEKILKKLNQVERISHKKWLFEQLLILNHRHQILP